MNWMKRLFDKRKSGLTDPVEARLLDLFTNEPNKWFLERHKIGIVARHKERSLQVICGGELGWARSGSLRFSEAFSRTWETLAEARVGEAERKQLEAEIAQTRRAIERGLDL